MINICCNIHYVWILIWGCGSSACSYHWSDSELMHQYTCQWCWYIKGRGYISVNPKKYLLSQWEFYILYMGVFTIVPLLLGIGLGVVQ